MAHTSVAWLLFCWYYLYDVGLTNAKTIHSTKIAFGSCIFPSFNKSILSRISERRPDLFIITGDATYLDYQRIEMKSDIGTLRGHFVGVPSEIAGKCDAEIEEHWRSIWDLTVKDEHWLRLQEHTRIMGTLDDHDYGKNDGDYSHVHRELAQRLFLDAMNVGNDDARRQRNGVYVHDTLQVDLGGGVHKTIDIVLLDIRFFSKEDGAENILGSQQWQWLEDVLWNRLHGDLCVVVSGIQITPVSRRKTSETWGRYHASQQRLFELVAAVKTKKQQEIILISGDVHRGEIMKVVCHDEKREHFQEIVEVTSSGLTHSVGEDAPFLIRNFVKLLHRLEVDGITQCVWRGINFGELVIEWNEQFSIDRIVINILDDAMRNKCQSVVVPMTNSRSDWHDVLQQSEYAPWMSSNCYGAQTLYTPREKYWYQAWFDLMYILVPILPVLLMGLSLLTMTVICKYVLCGCKGAKQKTT